MVGVHFDLVPSAGAGWQIVEGERVLSSHSTFNTAAAEAAARAHDAWSRDHVPAKVRVRQPDGSYLTAYRKGPHRHRPAYAVRRSNFFGRLLGRLGLGQRS